MEESSTLSGAVNIREHPKRLKERFRDHGLAGFNSREALELLLALTEIGQNPGEQAEALITDFGSIGGVIGADECALSSIDGEGLDEDGLVLMGLIKNLAHSYGKEQVTAPTVIRTKQEVLYHVNKAVPCRRGEKLLAIYLNSRNEALGTWVLHEGPVSCETVTPRRAIEGAFHHNGQGVIFVHRHDRASARPTEQEARLIKELWLAASAVDIVVHDHLISTRLSLYSALEDGLIFTGTENQSNQSMAASPLSRNFRLKRW